MISQNYSKYLEIPQELKYFERWMKLKCVCDIAFLLNMTQSAVSHQLRVLKQADLVKNRRAGKIVFYFLDDEHVKQIFNQGLTHILELREDQ